MVLCGPLRWIGDPKQSVPEGVRNVSFAIRRDALKTVDGGTDRVKPHRRLSIASNRSHRGSVVSISGDAAGYFPRASPIAISGLNRGLCGSKLSFLSLLRNQLLTHLHKFRERGYLPQIFRIWDELAIQKFVIPRQYPLLERDVTFFNVLATQ